MWLMILSGIIALGGGVGLLGAPQRMVGQMPPRATGSWIHTDPFIFKHRVSTGISLIAMGLFCLSSALYVWMRVHS